MTPAPERVLPPVPLQSTGTVAGTAEVKVVRLQSVTSQGAGIGQVAGAPSVAVTLMVTNRSTPALPVTNVNVSVTYGAGDAPGVQVDGPPGAPFSGTLAPGRSGTGTYVFSVPTDQRERGVISVNVDPRQPTVRFEGPLR